MTLPLSNLLGAIVAVGMLVFIAFDVLAGISTGSGGGAAVGSNREQRDLYTTTANSLGAASLRRNSPETVFGTSPGGEQQHLTKAKLLPVPVDLIRRGIPIELVYDFGPPRNFSGDCSCLNPRSSYECCKRDILRSHKMGTVLTKKLFDAYKPQIMAKNKVELFHYWDHLPESDYRDVIVFRNIYSSLVSGYLFHREGKECTRDNWRTFLAGGEWINHVGYALEPHPDGRHLCAYLEQTTEEVGMRAYVEWVFKYYYAGILSHWALGQEVPEVMERTRTLCYEDFMSPERDRKSIDAVLSHWFNGTDTYEPFPGDLPGHVGEFTGDHATSHDPNLRTRLKELIFKIDREHYNGEIEWLSATLPC